MKRAFDLRFAFAATAVALAFAATAEAQVINEFVTNHSGDDVYVYVEVAGAPNTDLSSLRVLEVDGDGADAGRINYAWSVGTTNATGHWVSSTSPAPNDPANDVSVTLLLVSGFSGSVLADLDPDNDGDLDLTPWTTLLDSVAVTDNGASDRHYSPTVLAPSFDGVSFVPGGASRIPDGTDTDAVSDWVRNDFNLAGIPGNTGTLVAGEAANTPGAVNSETVAGGGARLNEVVLDLDGADTEEYVEIWGSPTTSYSTTWVVVLDSDTSGNPGLVEAAIQAGTTSGAGLWSSGFLAADTLGDQSRSVLVVEGWSGTVGTDLDPGNDGTLDTTPWTALGDSLAVTDGSGVDLPYSAVVLAPAYDGTAGKVGGASRFPNGVDTDTTADWYRNDPDYAEPPVLLPQSGLAFNTPADPNLVPVATLYDAVDATTPEALRATLHAAIDDHIKVPYTSSETDTWNVLNEADEDPVDSSAILDIYKNAVYTKISGGDGVYNREHSWPNSWGFPDDGTTNYPYTDCHHLFASDKGYNSNRGNLPYGTCNGSCSEDATLSNHGVGGTSSGEYPGDSNWYTGGGNTGIHETWPERRGDVARAQLYLELRYEGGTHGASGYTEPDLRLTDDTGLIVGTGNNEAIAYMGRLSAILAWHQQDPPDDRERRRNDVVYSYQGNRNPFIDHPEWVDCLWLEECSLFSDGFESGDDSAWSSVP